MPDSLPHFFMGGVAGAVARTVVAPVERVKIIYQTSSEASYRGMAPAVWAEGGLFGFWRGNCVAVLRVFPYLGIQLASNEKYRNLVASTGTSASTASFVGGLCAGSTAVACTYPLDLARARLALLALEGHKPDPSRMLVVMRDAFHEGGLRTLYSGSLVSITGAGFYCGIKFLLFDSFKLKSAQDGDTKSVPYWKRAIQGGAAALIAQTVGYPIDVLRRRLQTGGAEVRARYPGILSGLTALYREGGLKHGLFRGLSLNYMKTIPNSMVYLCLFDVFKDKYAAMN